LLEFESSAPGLQSRYYLGNIIGNKTKSCVRMVLLYDYVAAHLLLLRAN
jgi:hypothetical protein